MKTFLLSMLLVSAVTSFGQWLDSPFEINHSKKVREAFFSHEIISGFIKNTEKQHQAKCSGGKFTIISPNLLQQLHYKTHCTGNKVRFTIKVHVRFGFYQGKVKLKIKRLITKNFKHL